MSVKSTVRRTARSARKPGKTVTSVPGPSSNPATNLLILDVAMRGAGMIAGRMVERGTLRARYSSDKAADIVKGRSLGESLVATSAARMATRSVPGFLLVAGGLFAKVVFDRVLNPRKSEQQGEKQLAKKAAKAKRPGR